MATKQQEVRLPTTSYAILGLLTFGEQSGYDLTKMVNSSVGFFWTPAKSQIYGELRRLVSLGYATEREVAQSTRPDKRLYAITPEGEDALREWLDESEAEPDTFKSAFLVKLFFGQHMDRDALVAQVEGYRRHAQEELAEFRRIEKDIAGHPATFYPYLTLKCGLANARATIRWADAVLKELENRGNG